MPKPAPKKPSRHRKLFWVLWGLLLLCAIAAASIVIWKYENDKAIAADRARFAQADQDIKKRGEEIINILGSPLHSNSHSWCSRPSVEWGESPLGCHIEKTIFYTVVDDRQASLLNDKTVRYLNSQWTFGGLTTSSNGPTSKGFAPLVDANYSKQTNYQSIVNNYVNSKINMDCSLSSIYYKGSDPPFPDYVLSNSALDILALSIGCGNHSRVATYPIE